MFGLSRLLKLTGSTLRARKVQRGARVWLELLEDRTVPTLLGQQLFPADYPWNQNIHDAPLVSNSASIISNIGSTIGIHPDWGEANPSNGNDPLYGIPVNVVHGNTAPKVTVVIDDYADESDVMQVPMPANPIIEGDYQNGPNPNGPGYNDGQRGDSHLIIWDEDNNIAYEFFLAARPGDPGAGGVWHAAQESVWDMNANSFRSLGWTSADAAGLSILAGLARPDEGLPVAEGGQGSIDHALRFTLPSSKILPQYIYPASHVVNVSSGSNKLPFGARLRLADTPAVNLKISQLDPQAQIIAHAMQQYGLVLSDIGSAMYVTGSSASVNANNVNNLVWNMDDVLGLSALKAGDFEVVDLTPRVTGLSASTASPGGAVTVIGQNFSGSAGHLAVLFGSTPATSVQYVDDSHIIATVPFGSGTVNITVRSGVIATDPNSPSHNAKNPVFGYGTSAVTAAGAFTYGTSQSISAANSTVGFATSTSASGAGNTVTIVVQDTSGDPVGGLGSGAFQFALSGGTSTGTFGTVSATATPGSYTATFSGVLAGTASTLTLTIAGVTLNVTPTIAVTPGAVSGSKSSVSFASGTVNVGDPVVVTLLVKDAAGNAITGLTSSAFGFSLATGISSGTFGTVAATATPGTYTTTFTGATAGSPSTLTATVNGIALNSHPTITVTSSTAFSDDFGVAGPGLGLINTWARLVGGFGVNTSAHTATGSGATNLAIINSIYNADEAVAATITVTGTQRAGLVLRHNGPGDKNMYWGTIVAAGSGKYKAVIYRNVNGKWTALFVKTYVGAVTNAALEFDAIGTSLRLFLNGSIVAYANDTVLAGAGSVGMRASAGAIIKNFSAHALALQSSASATAFSDSFTTTGGNNQLSDYWFNQRGNVRIDPNTGAAVGVGSTNLATVNGVSNADESVNATITLTGTQRAGLVLRHAGAGDRNMYWGTIVAAGSGKYKAVIYRNVNGKWTALFAKTYLGSVANAALEFDAVGSSLRLFLNGGIVAYANDATLTAAGGVGIRTSFGAIVNDFAAGALASSNGSLPFSDNFNTAGANGQLKTSWFNRLGNTRTSAGAATGVDAKNLATVNGISAANVTVQANITLAAVGQSAGLVARYAGSGDQNMYLAQVAQAGANAFKATLYVNTGGIWKVLKSQTVASGTGTLRLAISGNNMTVTYAGSVLFTAVDASITAAGAVGLRLTSGAAADNFSAS